MTIDGATVTVDEGGTYVVRGTLEDGQILVDVGDDDVTLVLDGVDITHADGAAVAVMAADEALVLLADGSTNRLADGATYVFADPEVDEPNATLYSAADLVIGGSGALEVVAAHNDGIASKDDLVIADGLIRVSAVDDGVRGKDSVIVSGGGLVIDAGGDGIKADNDEDPDRGYVVVADGALAVTAGDDAIQAATSVTIDGGSLELAAGDDGIHGDLRVTVNGGSLTISEAFEGIEAEVIEINDGRIDVTSDDDGLNATSAEASTVADATVDDRGGRPGGRAPEVVGEHYVYINGGTISITTTGALAEQGDGIDANGHIVMTGGVVSISGATDTRNSALDYSGGTFEMQGGVLIGTNIDGRNSQGIGVGSTQPSLYVSTGGVVPAGTVVQVVSSDGESLVTFEPANDFDLIVFSSPDLVEGEAYEIRLGAGAGESLGTVTASR